MESLFLESAGVGDFILELAKRSKVFTTRRVEDNFYWQRFRLDSAYPFTWNSFRTVEPLKSFFFPARITVAVYPAPNSTSPAEAGSTVLFGAKACDLRSLNILDYVFKEGDFKDPFYIDSRAKTVIIAGDCSEYRENCFCLALGINPYPEENFDLGFSEVSGGFIFRIGSPKGESLIKSYQAHFKKASAEQIKERENKRKEFLKAYRKKISRDNFPDKSTWQENVKRHNLSQIWEDRSEKCVECGACNLVCPTCHCFILEDYKRAEEKFARARIWDSCQYKGFARVAGGANPRSRLAERIRNRFIKKFDFFPVNAGLYACTGCGRCSEACIAGIDIREVLKELSSA